MLVTNERKTALRNLLGRVWLNPEMDSWEVSQTIREARGGELAKVYSGASKMVLLFPGDDFVVKYSSDRDGDKGDCDEAMDEWTLYTLACEEGLGHLFPTTEYLFTINGINFVAQQKIDFSAYNAPVAKERAYHKIARTVSRKHLERATEELGKGSERYRREVNSLWAGMIISLYGKEVCKRLCAFIQTHGINDLHEENVGYLHDRPVILDFSGYSRD